VGIKAAIIGLGVGEQHIQGYRSHPACDVVALCDLDEQKLESCRSRYPGVRTSTDAVEILTDPEIDVVSIASYDNYHYEQVALAIRHGKHVFVEKPLCLFEEEARDLRRALAERPDLKLSSNLILRRSPRFMAVRDLLRAGRLGDPYYLESDYNYGRLHKLTEGWRGALDFYSVVYGGGVHAVDLLRWLIGERVVEVSSYGNRVASRGSQFQRDDFVVSLLKFESGTIGKISANFGCVSPHFHTLVIYGTKATFINDVKSGRLIESRDPDHKGTQITEEYPGTHKGDLIYSFVDSIVHGTCAEVTTDDVFDTMSVCFAIEQSLAEGQPVRVKAS
jgi:predicted dehydrogenase